MATSLHWWHSNEQRRWSHQRKDHLTKKKIILVIYLIILKIEDHFWKVCWITFLHQPATPLNPVVGLPAHVVPPLDRMTLFCSSLLQSERSLESVARSRQESLSSIEEDDYDTLDDIHSDKNIVRTKVRENHFSCLRMAQMWLSAHLAYLEWKDLWMCKVVLTSSTSGY